MLRIVLLWENFASMKCIIKLSGKWQNVWASIFTAKHADQSLCEVVLVNSVVECEMLLLCCLFAFQNYTDILGENLMQPIHEVLQQVIFNSSFFLA